MPSKLSPVECASKGWINVALNTLQCQMSSYVVTMTRRCKVKVIVQLNNALSPKAMEDLEEQYYRDLSSRHAESCPWHNICGCEQITNPLTLPRTLLLEAFDQRLNSFAACHVPSSEFSEM